jgi:hypothetical protein
METIEKKNRHQVIWLKDKLIQILESSLKRVEDELKESY